MESFFKFMAEYGVWEILSHDFFDEERISAGALYQEAF
jgi:hypothetical protein